jgi:branched-chain amino acid aminotransferase
MTNLTPRTWVNGRLLAEAEAVIPVNDHGLVVGDGIFETLKVLGGVPFALSRHLNRLAVSARGLGLPEPDEGLLRSAVAETLADAGAADVRLRITYTSGPSPWGSERGGAAPTVIIAVSPLTGFGATASVACVPWRRNEHGAVAGLKTTSYAENVVALAHARERGASEAIFANTAGDLCEGTGSNVFVVLDGILHTPPLSSGCLAGITRELVVTWVGAQETSLPLEVLSRADEVFLSSSTRDVQPVTKVDDRVIPVGPVTERAAQLFATHAARNSDP